MRSETGIREHAACSGGHDLPSSVEVLVVGCGPVGATIGGLLARDGVRVLVVDKATEIFMAPRAIALDNDALRILQFAGVTEADLDTVAIPYVRMRSPWFGEFGRLNSLGSIDCHPKLVTFYQPDLERCLRAQLRTCNSAQTGLGVALVSLDEKEDHVVATLDIGEGRRHAVRARYVVGADGASSVVRQMIGQAFKGKTFAEDWLIVDAREVRRPIDHVEFICDHRRPTPHMTAPGGRERWEFMLHSNEIREEMESDESIRKLLQPWGGMKDMVIERKAVYRFHARTVRSFRSGRIFLAGDAAHITPPFVGQGLVAGLRDAANLSWKLAWVIKGHAAPHILDSYDQERRPHVKAMIGVAKFMGKLVMPRNAGVAIFTHGLMRLSRFIPALRNHFDELGIKPKNAFRRGLFVPGAARTRLVRGAVLPQGWLRNCDGAIRMSDDVLGTGFTLIGFGKDAGANLDPCTRAAFIAAGGSVVQVVHRGQRLHRTEKGWWEDLDGTFMPRVVGFGWAAVVRPDKTILHEGPVTESTRIVLESLQLLGAHTSLSTRSSQIAMPSI
ncbi:bifunctional 3-(3-hydroxy-phenyl)propionate/3-hydroxycinnamic acid hydroxylase [Burkholderia sp. Nafp2/4-1b]|uniref:bifunctional 3-(3-hydroxy-phenyl)propionate/3-hydroxycinnamic acid hydroxylase n=1 Tax=Burkholderia sp. Nafp2/4-1b TaxID=2116686 RepID=UPI001F08B580|nr:bifunctional 3-(3-hydroxy-phenyl)propionate/3-hydroxycinnamic acid hydroxylase [Burkholderia sp. Nafp2/4-1b]